MNLPRRGSVAEVGPALQALIKPHVRNLARVFFVHDEGTEPTNNSAERALRTTERSSTLAPELLHFGCLLCSEKRPDRCRRRLVAEYLQRQGSLVTWMALRDDGGGARD